MNKRVWGRTGGGGDGHQGHYILPEETVFFWEAKGAVGRSRREESPLFFLVHPLPSSFFSLVPLTSTRPKGPDERSGRPI